MKLLYLYGEEFTGTRAREVHTLNRVHSLAEAGVEVTLLAATSQRFNSDSLLHHFNLAPAKNLQIAFVPRQLKLGPWRMTSTGFFYRNAQRWLEQNSQRGGGFDLAYVIHLKAARFLAARGTHLLYIFEAHEIFADSYPADSGSHEKLKKLEQLVYDHASAVVATSKYLRNELQAQYSITKPSIIIPNSVSEKFFQLQAGGDPKRLIYIGSFQHWKGVDIAVEAMRSLPSFTLDIAGGNSEQIAALKTNAPSNITFHGFLKQEQFTGLLERAAIALIPNRLTPRSSLYSFPMKLLEYGAAGKIVVATDLPVLRELNPGPWCQLITPENPAAIAEGVKGLEIDPALHKAAQQWTRNFTWSKQAEQLKPFLEQTRMQTR